MTAMTSSRMLQRVCPPQYHAAARQLVAVKAVPRLLLTNAAALLCGFDARDDPVLHILIAAFAMEHVAKVMTCLQHSRHLRSHAFAVELR
jgi:hypothetical protein